MKRGSQCAPKVVGTLVLAALLAACGGNKGPTAAGDGSTLRVPQDFRTIQEAVDAAGPGAVIRVDAGTFSENVVISKPDLTLRGAGGRTVLDGSGRLGIGIHVRGGTGQAVQRVEVSGLVVQGFERGIVLENVRDSRVRFNEARNNLDKQGPNDLFEGIVLIASHGNEIYDNFSHDNGHDGIMLTGGSSGNLIRANHAYDNGAQTAPGLTGCGINLVGSRDNQIEANEVLRNHWGIHLTGGSSGNRVSGNRTHENGRAGIGARATASGNVIEQNQATGNARLDLAPSGGFDLFDEGPLDNEWRANQGRANMTGAGIAERSGRQ